MQYEKVSVKRIVRDQLKRAFAVTLAGLAIALILAFPVKWVWNWLMPDLFGWPELSAIQAWGLAFLSRLIFPTHAEYKNDKSKVN